MDLEGRLVYSIIHLIATSLLSSRQHYVLRLNCYSSRSHNANYCSWFIIPPPTPW